jgi:DNA-3-methyladenine glycosylase I
MSPITTPNGACRNTIRARLWEKLVLDGFQAGLSWITILRKRDAFRECFEGFDPERVARWGEPEIENALQNPGIIRHRGKIEATVTGARCYLEIEGARGFRPLSGGFVGGRPIQNA